MRTLLKLLLSSDFMPHGHCYLWKPGLVWLQVVSNLFIGLAYVSISLTLLFLTRQLKRALPFQWIYLAFGLFIVTCGITHFMDIVTIWTPLYWLDGGIRAVTAVASAVTAGALFWLFPKAIKLAALVAAEHKQSRYDIATKEREVRTIIDGIPTLAWSARADGQVDFYNHRWCEYTGTKPDQMEGWGWRAVHDPLALPNVMLRWKASILGGTAFEMIFPLRRVDGTFRAHLSRAQPIFDANGVLMRWFGTITDIEDQLHVERTLAEAVRVRDEFLMVASHELRTPLTTLRLLTDRIVTAVRNGRADKIAPKVDMLSAQLNRLERLASTLLEVSHIGTGPVNLDLTEFNLSDLVREAVATFGDELSHSCSRLTLHADKQVMGSWDRMRLGLVVTILLSNALKYGSGKPIEIIVDQDVFSSVSVRDEGIGISPDKTARIFARFARAVDAKNYGGLGLGLWLSKQIVEAHGGLLHISSQPNDGSTFVIELPRRMHLLASAHLEEQASAPQ
jgi:PAS domain S-box-containing protein